ncbi:hypothetical protein [Sphingobacterium sp. GVS05A]|uniref:hypothetical protein n=1 Tax=Sphingobacterium sp. GVS05A TaxID=2862679 RepID=UPI001CBCE795|nr:hypothetical protein [Sphingobacterium sp. GVS05A]
MSAISSMHPYAKATNELSFSNQESSFRTLFGVPNEAKSSTKKISPLTDLKKYISPYLQHFTNRKDELVKKYPSPNHAFNTKQNRILDE